MSARAHAPKQTRDALHTVLHTILDTVLHAPTQVFKQAGFKVTKGDAWSVLWGRPAELLTEDVLRALGPFQRINHFPGEHAQ
jgi:hypothetical protein